MLILFLLILFLFACFVLNAGEHKLYRPGIARPLTIVLIVLLAGLLWPVYGPYVQWLMPR